jgi:large subunit ribosomal protein L3
MKYILGKKMEMTQVWHGDQAISVTKVQAGPCVVVCSKNIKNDSYEAVQLGFGERKEKNIKKPQKGHLKGLGNIRFLREFRVAAGDLKRGDKIDVSTFTVGDEIDVIATSKGKGFQGGVKRHGFSGSKKTHGNKDQLRMPGSVGATGPAHIFKGTRMAGRMGGDRVTIKNSEIVEIDLENNILMIKGGIPGAKNGLVIIQGEGELIFKAKEATEVVAPKEEETKK